MSRVTPLEDEPESVFLFPLIWSFFYFFRSYSSIQNTDQRQRYKQEFNTEYEEYKELHSDIEKVCKKFNQLQDLLKKTPKHTVEFEVGSGFMYLP